MPENKKQQDKNVYLSWYTLLLVYIINLKILVIRHLKKVICSLCYFNPVDRFSTLKTNNYPNYLAIINH